MKNCSFPTAGEKVWMRVLPPSREVLRRLHIIKAVHNSGCWHDEPIIIVVEENGAETEYPVSCLSRLCKGYWTD